MGRERSARVGQGKDGGENRANVDRREETETMTPRLFQVRSERLHGGFNWASLDFIYLLYRGCMFEVQLNHLPTFRHVGSKGTPKEEDRAVQPTSRPS